MKTASTIASELWQKRKRDVNFGPKEMEAIIVKWHKAEMRRWIKQFIKEKVLWWEIEELLELLK